jgi:predicted O-methyltransferase YrrM
MLKRFIQKAAVATSPLWERLGFHVVPAHYYFPVPPREDLPDELFRSVSECVGVDWQRAVQRQYLRDVFPAYLQEFDATPNGGLSLVDGAVLHAMIRHHKPRKIVEVGSGHTTRITAAACLRNQQDGHACEFVAIEPYPSAMLRAGLPGLTRLRVEKVQHVALDEFADCDLLFIDSSHVVRMGGDVTHIQLEVVPRLKPGCLVHFHDILLPGHYWKDWVRGRGYYWTEQYLLQAFLAFNTQFTVIWAARLMQLEAEGDLQASFPFYRGNDPNQRVSSLWIQRRTSQVTK